MTVIGIDPGLKGGIVIIETLPDRPYKINKAICYDMPTVKLKGSKTKLDIDISGLRVILSNKNWIFGHVFLEQVHAMPTQGVTSMFNFGKGYGILLGIINSLPLNLYHVTPRVWQKAISLDRGYDYAIEIIHKQMENLNAIYEGKKIKSGITDAMGLALYGYNKLIKENY